MMKLITIIFENGTQYQIQLTDTEAMDLWECHETGTMFTHEWYSIRTDSVVMLSDEGELEDGE